MDGRNNVSVANKEWEQWTLEAMGSASTRLSGYVDLHNVAAVAVVISVDGLEMSLSGLRKEVVRGDYDWASSQRHAPTKSPVSQTRSGDTSWEPLTRHPPHVIVPRLQESQSHVEVPAFNLGTKAAQWPVPSAQSAQRPRPYTAEDASWLFSHLPPDLHPSHHLPQPSHHPFLFPSLLLFPPVRLLSFTSSFPIHLRLLRLPRLPSSISRLPSPISHLLFVRRLSPSSPPPFAPSPTYSVCLLFELHPATTHLESGMRVY
ncbi:predicted protein [Histoplasma capsulatum H143]|uniref:Uncharacterized protein n=1 Tax=Ajellomyces capsulatus (strain H143) TaxID=544712 RepID=C6HPU8_AJECH|nr:predicted protein [Histoplasma capsulatum H143]